MELNFVYIGMIRSQILLTQSLIKEIESLSKKKMVSKSEMIRSLLEQSLNISKTKEIDSKDQEYIYTLPNYQGINPRINGFKELFTVGANTADVYVINHSLFEYYKKNKSLPSDFLYSFLNIGRELVKSSLTGQLVLRRAYYVPGLENPPGPRYVGVSPEKLEESLIGLYKFAIDNDYDVKEGYRIEAFVYPFADPEPLTVPIAEDVDLPYGGYAHPMNKNGSRVEILSVWGNNEGVQSFDSVDRYVVDSQRNIILEKHVPQKMIMLATTAKNQAEKIAVPIGRQFEQVLSDVEILEVGRIVSELHKKYGPRRIEFSYDGIKELEFNESSPYEIKRQEIKKLNILGTITTIGSENDLKKIKNPENQDMEKIVYIKKSVIENRSYDVLNAIAGLPRKLTVLYPGLSSTAHAMRILKDFGHTAIVVGNREFKEGDEIHLFTSDNGEIFIQNLKENPCEEYIQNLYDAQLFGLQKVGGKAYNLSLLKTNGYNIPHGVVLTTDFFDKVALDSGVKSIADVEALSISSDQWKGILASKDIDKNKLYSVRSSATVEDQKDYSFAGQFSTFLNVEFKDLKTNVENVMKSIGTSAVLQYVKAAGKGKSFKMAVVLQEMVEPMYSGVIFGKNIQTNNEDEIVIDIANGLAEGIVDGNVESTRVVFSRNEGEIIKAPDLKLVKITKAELNALVEMALSLERLMGGPQDIEWSIDKEGIIWLLQTRDV